jgi:subtilisin family serine protease
MENHEDVPALTLPLSGISHPFFKDHGTAVLGILTMKDNSIGGIGITPKAKGYILSQWRPDGYFNIADALLTSIHYLGFGDVLLIQSQAYDSRTEKAMPVEIYDANFHLIRLATALGIIVIEPAGNGDNFYGYDLDLFLSLAGQTPLNRTSKDFRDSGAIIVAAATSNAPHKKIDFSNYGSRVDCYAWGENVLTAGYFPASSGKATNTYTKTFSGTSSASAIITGATIALQNIIESNLHCRYDPFKIRAILSNVMLGTSSVNGHSIDKIGVMPDLKNILKDMLQVNFPSDKKHRHQKRQEIFEPKNVEVL